MSLALSLEAGKRLEMRVCITDQTNPQWDEWDNEARAELVEKYRDFGYPVLTGRVNRCATLDVYRDGEHVGYVDVDPSGIDWVIQTRRVSSKSRSDSTRRSTRKESISPGGGCF